MPTNCSPLTRQIKEKNLQIACFQISALPPMIILIAYSMYGSTKFRFDIFWCVCVSLLRIVADSIKSIFFPLLRRTVYDNHSRLLVTSRKESIAHNLFAKKGNEMVGKKEKEKEKEKEKVSPMSNHRPSRV